MSGPSAAVTVTPTQGLALNGDATNIAVDAAGNPDNTGYAGMLNPFLSGDGRYAFFATLASSNLMPTKPAAKLPISYARTWKQDRSTLPPSGLTATPRSR